MSECKSPITLLTGADVAAKRLLQFSTGEAIHNVAAATQIPIGVSEYAADDGDMVAIRTLSEDGTLEMTAAGVIALDADVYAAAAGKVQALPTDGGTYMKVGIAIEAATADGDIIEVLPYGFGTTEKVDITHTALAPALTPGAVNIIDSSVNAVDGTLADDTEIGRETYIVMTDASNSSTVSIASHVTSDPEVATFNATDETLTLKWNGTEYETIHGTATFV
jgi:hypothetical protein